MLPSLSFYVGHPKGQYHLAQCYEVGIAVRLSVSRAFKWYTAAASQDHPEALRVVGECYEQGLLGVSKSVPRAIEFYTRAAKKGLPRAQVRS